MDAQPGMAADPGAQASDLEYDLAHEAMPTAAATPEDDEPQMIWVPTQTPEYDGDLGYELSHEVPGRG